MIPGEIFFSCFTSTPGVAQIVYVVHKHTQQRGGSFSCGILALSEKDLEL